MPPIVASVKLHRLAIAIALGASIAYPLPGASTGEALLDPRGAGESVSYRLDAERHGTKEPSSLHTQLSIAVSGDGVVIASTTPAASATGTRGASGEIIIAGKLRQVVEPFNEIQTALSSENARHESQMNVLLGDTSASVPVIATTVGTDGGNTTVTFVGQTDATVKAFKAHVAVNVRAVFAGSRLLTATATNEITAHILFRAVHIQQTWALARI
jgi:hypothetical protein